MRLLLFHLDSLEWLFLQGRWGGGNFYESKNFKFNSVILQDANVQLVEHSSNPMVSTSIWLWKLQMWGRLWSFMAWHKKAKSLFVWLIVPNRKGKFNVVLKGWGTKLPMLAIGKTCNVNECLDKWGRICVEGIVKLTSVMACNNYRITFVKQACKSSQ